jgi:DNA polymerase III alpha subunit
LQVALDYPLSKAELHLRTHLLADQLRASVEQENRQLKRLSLGGRSPKGNEVLVAQVQALRKELKESRRREQTAAAETEKALAEAKSWEQQARDLQSELQRQAAVTGPATAQAVPEQQKRELEEELARLLQEAQSSESKAEPSTAPVRRAAEAPAGSQLNAVYSHVMRGLFCLRFRDSSVA